MHHAAITSRSQQMLDQGGPRDTGLYISGDSAVHGVFYGGILEMKEGEGCKCDYRMELRMKTRSRFSMKEMEITLMRKKTNKATWRLRTRMDLGRMKFHTNSSDYVEVRELCLKFEKETRQRLCRMKIR